MRLPFVLSTDHDQGVDEVKSWLDFNNFDYSMQSFWLESQQRFAINLAVQKHIVVWHHSILQKFLTQAGSIDEFLRFAEQGNQLWIIGMDSALVAMESYYNDLLHQLDSKIPYNALVMFFDAQPTVTYDLLDFEQIVVIELKYNFFLKSRPRVQAATQHKTHAEHDFLLTMINKCNREHRDILWRQINCRPNLVEKGIMIFHAEHSQTWLGQTQKHNPWKDGHASMDLYLDSLIEIVPETCHSDLLFFTEKSYKPIMTMTPFIMITTAGYLGYLKSLGFKTFDSLIDESYDTCEDVNDRVRQAVDLLADIVSYDTKEFYHASKEILQHNFNNLCEISGKWQHSFDEAMWRAFEKFACK